MIKYITFYRIGYFVVLFLMFVFVLSACTETDSGTVTEPEPTPESTPEPEPEPDPEPTIGTNYYVSNTGDDSKDGRSPSTAWRTTSKVSNTSFSQGDSILFKRGDVFRGDIDITSSGTPEAPITYRAYGVGEKPLFLGSIDLDDENEWLDLGANRWASSNGSFPSDVGFMLLGEESIDNVGIKCETMAEVNDEREFWHDEDNERVVLYCPQNPAIEFLQIEIAFNTSPFDHFIEASSEGVSHINIENLEIKYWNSHAIAFVNAVGIEIRNCDISFGGGVYYWKTARMGNGIEFWTNAQDCIVDGCKVGQCYDSGVTIQGQRTQSYVSNIHFNNNILWGNDMASFEIAFVNNETNLQNIYFENNVSIGAGRGWSRPQKLDATMGWDVTTWAGYAGTFDGLYIKNNVYYQPADACLYYKWQTDITNFEMDNNYYYKPEHILIYWGSDLYAMRGFSDFQNVSGQDANSIANDDRLQAQNAARTKVSSDNIFFLNTLFQEVDEQMSSNQTTSFDLISPADGSSVGDIATLAWESSSDNSEAILDHYEVWIDGAKVADVSAGTTSYTTSALSAGSHNWFVIAVCDNGNWRQSTCKFTFLK